MADSSPPKRLRPLRFILALVALSLVCIGLVELWPKGKPERQPVADTAKPTAPVASAATSAPAPATATAAKSVWPGTPVSPQQVLEDMGHWRAEHPNMHAVVETSSATGTVLARVEVFARTNGAGAETVNVKSDVFLPAAPQPMQFQAQVENGKLRAYFPRSNQVIEMDSSSATITVPGMAAGSQAAVTDLLKFARTSFGEASADLRVVTMVLSPEALNLPAAPSDIYLSLRTDMQGKLLGTETVTPGTRVVSTMRYVSFDRDQVVHDAPAFPTGKVPTAGKSFQSAMEEEARLVMNKSIAGTKI